MWQRMRDAAEEGDYERAIGFQHRMITMWLRRVDEERVNEAAIRGFTAQDIYWAVENQEWEMFDEMFNFHDEEWTWYH